MLTPASVPSEPDQLGGGASSTAALFFVSRAMLTARQLECLYWVMAGKSPADIGVILGTSRHTVDEHIPAACRRLGVRNPTQAVAAAIARGLLTPSTP